MGNRAARRAQPQPAPLPNTTYVPGPNYPPGPSYPPRGYRQICSPYAQNYRRQYPGYPPIQPYY